MKSKKSFTLLEVLSAFLLIAMSSSFLGLKLFSYLDAKKFSTDVDKVVSRLSFLHMLSQINHQDLCFRSEKNDGKIIFSSSSLNQNYFFQDHPLTIEETQFILNQSVTENLDFTFYSTGQVMPSGVLKMLRKEMKKEISLCDLFSFYEGGRQGPFHPLKEERF